MIDNLAALCWPLTIAILAGFVATYAHMDPAHVLLVLCAACLLRIALK